LFRRPARCRRAYQSESATDQQHTGGDCPSGSAGDEAAGLGQRLGGDVVEPPEALPRSQPNRQNRSRRNGLHRRLLVPALIFLIDFTEPSVSSTPTRFGEVDQEDQARAPRSRR